MKNKIDSISTSTKDIIIIIFITSIISFVLISYDAFELFTDFAEEFEEYELDEIILIILVASLCTIWYSIRRYKENQILYKENLKKDALLYEQSKKISQGEMLNNIAHQWRQPLSIISTSASGLQLVNSYGSLKKDELNKTLDSIIETTKYLSETIDTFRDFIKNEKNIISFNLDESIYSNLNILEGLLKTSNIVYILNLNVNMNIKNYPKELRQIFINIINNSNDAFMINNIKEKYIFISSKKNDNEVIIKIKDNAKGIRENTLNKIFEPYYTTKHESQGKGLGLFMVYNIITERMKGKIFVNNLTFEYNNKEFSGVEFTIVLPIDVK